jgi:MarR family transcriptional regulator for hemolysin
MTVSFAGTHVNEENGNDWQAALIWCVLPTGRSWQRAVSTAFSKHGISLSLASPMLIVSRLGDGINQKVVAEESGIQSGTLVRSLDYLEQNALLVRKPDPRDRRINTLHLTRKGRKMVAELESILNELLQQVLAGINGKDGEAAVKVLNQMEAASRSLA